MGKHIIYFNGAYVALSAAMEGFLTPGQEKLDGVFETMRVEEGQAVDTEAHLKRLFKGLKVLGIKHKLSTPTLKQVIRQVIKLNVRITVGRLRICVYRDKDAVHCSVMILNYKVLPLKKYSQGLKLCVMPTQRKATAVFADVKSLDYAFFAKAHAQAIKKGCDDVILLNAKGCVFESSRANVFVVVNNKWMTPPLSSGCLNGITRQHVMALMAYAGKPVKEAPITLPMLKKAHDVYLTNSLMGMMKSQCLLAPGGLTRYN